MFINIQSTIGKIIEIPKEFLIMPRKKSFTKDEDAKLSFLVQRYGTNNWEFISKLMQTRNARQCKDRYTNYLSPQINLNPWTQEEDDLLIKKVNELGNKWVKISKFFIGRSDNSIKNRWYTHLNKKNQKDNDDNYNQILNDDSTSEDLFFDA